MKSDKAADENIQKENQENTATAAAEQQAETAEGNENQEMNKTETSETEKLEAKLAEEKDKFVRLFAEFENYKKRMTKDRIELINTAGREVLEAMLPVLDDFDRALKNIEDETAKKGVELIQHKLLETLKAKGLKAMDSTVNQAFDPETMEAITQIAPPMPEVAGKVIDEVEKGYTLGGKIIRFPKVVVAQKPE